MRFVFLNLMILSAIAPGQTTQPQPTPAAVFDSSRSRLLADMDRQPRYACVQNIVRQMYRASSGEKKSCSAIISAFDARKHDPPLTSWDRLRLDVTIADNQEIHAWSGAPQFSEDEVRRFAGGPFGNGDFGTYISTIFGGGATVKFEGTRVLDGRTLFDYTYEVPVRASGYHVVAGSAFVVTAYGGSFALDPQTADIAELTVRTAELPENTPVACQARSEIEYGRLDIHGREVLIPRETRLRVIDRDGGEGLNTVSYSSCHEYTSKSVLRFDSAEPSAAATLPPQSAKLNPPPVPFPEGLKLNCRIVTPLDSDTAVAGSSIEGVLRAPVRGKNGTVLAPSGAHIHARLVRFAQYKADALDYFQVGVHLESIDIDGTQVPLYATLADQAAAPVPPMVAQLQKANIFGDSVKISGDRQTFLDSAYFPPPLPAEAGVFFFVREHLKLNQFDSSWITTAPEANKENQATLAGKENQTALPEKGQKQILDTEVKKVTPVGPADHGVPPSPAQIVSKPPDGTLEAKDQAQAAQNPPTPPGQTENQSPFLPNRTGTPSPVAQTNDKTPTETQDRAPFQLKVASNLVVVRVVVRNAQGKPVEGLHKEDFKLFDRSKEQSITQFEVETSALPPSASVVQAPGQSAPLPPPATPGGFLALYFDDLNTSDTDLMQARDAADHYLAANLQPKDRVAIFTSGKMLSDFTSDLKQIHEALDKLHASPRALKRVRDCPDLSDYQARQIMQFEDDYTIDAWKVALDEVASRCPNPNPVPFIQTLARDIVSQAEIQSRTSLQELERIVQYTSRMPGQRTIVLVSPGFPSQSEQYQLNRIIDFALRSQVVISSLDPKGLALLMRETDVTLGYNPSANSGVIGAMHNVDSAREFVATDVLAEVAQGTGGEFFHSNNDLRAGFGALAGSPVYYILAFAPTDVKVDGKFHALKVTLTEKHSGFSLQARRGYFATKEGTVAEVPPQVETRPQVSATTDADAQEKEKIREGPLFVRLRAHNRLSG